VSRKYPDLYTRLVAHVTVPEHQCESTGCWVHDGALNREGGYPRVTLWCKERKKCYKVMAHRLMFELVHGEIPETHEIDHRCHTHRCIHPDHIHLLLIPDNRAKNQWAIRR
jgi:hypothetical protein